MLRTFHANGFDTADAILRGLACLGYELERGSTVLDFGCGGGGLVYRLRELGFEAYGFDIHDTVAYGSPEDKAWFRFIENPQSDTSNTVVDWSKFNVTFDSKHFDLVVSTTVLEHIFDPRSVMAELARVLRPEGCALHFYPRKSTIIEPHIFVPLASRIQSWWWFYLWASVGVRNEFQRQFSAREVADRNTRYCQTGLRYHTDDEMYSYCSPYFGSIQFVDDLYYATVNPKHERQAIWQALKSEHPINNLAAIPKLRVLLACSPKTDRAGMRV